jgi:hypothetical protein
VMSSRSLISTGKRSVVDRRSMYPDCCRVSFAAMLFVRYNFRGVNGHVWLGEVETRDDEVEVRP